MILSLRETWSIPDEPLMDRISRFRLVSAIKSNASPKTPVLFTGDSYTANHKKHISNPE